MKERAKTAMITGASSGIGAAYAKQLAEQGYDLVLIARRETRLQQLAVELEQSHAVQVEIMTADLSQSDDLMKVTSKIEQLEQLDVVVNCAGAGALGLSQKVSTVQIHQMLQVNIVALTEISLAAVKRLSQQGGGKLINIGSILAMMPTAGAAAYSASKAYVLSFSRSLQLELKSQGVLVQVVMPGPIKTEFFAEGAAPFPEDWFMQAETLVQIALQALARGEDLVFPNLENLSLWQQHENSRLALSQGLTQVAAVPTRYR